MNKIVQFILLSFIGLIGFGGLVIAAPNTTFQRNLLPETTTTYDLGTTTPANEWKNIFTQNLTVSGTCTGCGGGFGEAWSLTTNTFSQSALTPTTTQNILVNGTGTSTIAGGLEVWRQIGAPYFHATSSKPSTLPYASTTALSVSSLTSGRVPYASTGGLLVDSSNLTYDGTLFNVGTNVILSGTGTSTITNLKTNTLEIGVLEYSYTQLQAPSFYATSTSQTSTFATAPTFSTLTSALVLTGAGGLTAEYTGTTCTSQFVTVLSALGAATCASINNDYWSGTDLSVANGGTNASSLGSHMILGFNGTSVVATSTPTAAAYLATSTTATSTFAGGFSAGNNSAFVVNQAATANSLYITSSGNVGIGTTGPDGTLHVHTATAGTIAADASADQLVIENSATGGLSFLTPNDATQNIFFGDPDNSSIGRIQYAHSLDAMLFTVNAGEKVRIQSDGNVGIGTTTPGSLLSVHGNGLFSGDLSIAGLTATGTVAFTGTTATTTISGGLSVGNNAALVVNQAATANSLYITNTGNVGIGTTSPGAPLHVSAGASGKQASFTGANGVLSITDGSRIETTRSILYFGYSPASDMDFNNGKVIFKTSGNVGIGTTSPASKLSVQGMAIISGNLVVAGITATSTVNFASATVVQHQYSSFTISTSTIASTTQKKWIFTTDVAETWSTLKCRSDVRADIQIYNGATLMNMVTATATPSLYSLTTNNTIPANTIVDVISSSSAPYQTQCTVDRTINQ